MNIPSFGNNRIILSYETSKGKFYLHMLDYNIHDYHDYPANVTNVQCK
jgi:hypothetical protein